MYRNFQTWKSKKHSWVANPQSRWSLLEQEDGGLLEKGFWGDHDGNVMKPAEC